MNISRIASNLELKYILKKSEFMLSVQWEFAYPDVIRRITSGIKEIDKEMLIELRDFKMGFIILDQEIIDNCNDLMRDFNDDEGTSFNFIMNIDNNKIRVSTVIILDKFMKSIESYFKSIGFSCEKEDEKNYLFY